MVVGMNYFRHCYVTGHHGHESAAGKRCSTHGTCEAKRQEVAKILMIFKARSTSAI